MNNNTTFHLVQESPWPLVASMSSLSAFISAVLLIHKQHIHTAIISIILLSITSYLWWRDVYRESDSIGEHNQKVITGLNVGMILFITSEVMLFMSFFWAFLHSSTSCTVELSHTWPPSSINAFDPISIPLMNTVILLSSGISVTWAHHEMSNTNNNNTCIILAITVILGLAFTILQLIEYNQAPFSISDSVFGSSFFIATGFHGLHVIIGTTFLLVVLIININGNINYYHSVSFECSAWYWHFVDVVWLFLYSLIYWWSY